MKALFPPQHVSLNEQCNPNTAGNLKCFTCRISAKCALMDRGVSRLSSLNRSEMASVRWETETEKSTRKIAERAHARLREARLTQPSSWGPGKGKTEQSLPVKRGHLPSSSNLKLASRKQYRGAVNYSVFLLQEGIQWASALVSASIESNSSARLILLLCSLFLVNFLLLRLDFSGGSEKNIFENSSVKVGKFWLWIKKKWCGRGCIDVLITVSLAATLK